MKIPNRFRIFLFMLAGFTVSMLMFIGSNQVRAAGEAQGETGILATVIYSEPINVRGGPSTVYYDIVGRVSPGDVLPALGVSPGREWVQISFPSAPGGVGWVYAAYVSVSGDLQIVEPPPTPTPFATATVNPTFAAAFIFQPTNTRMPTFTPAPPLEIPTFADASSPRSSGLPFGIVVLLVLVIGAIGYFVSSVSFRR